MVLNSNYNNNTVLRTTTIPFRFGIKFVQQMPDVFLGYANFLSLCFPAFGFYWYPSWHNSRYSMCAFLSIHACAVAHTLTCTHTHILFWIRFMFYPMQIMGLDNLGDVTRHWLEYFLNNLHNSHKNQTDWSTWTFPSRMSTNATNWYG